MTTLDALARPSGTFAMVAMDQRESLRTMLAQHHHGTVGDDPLVAFELAVATELVPYASGFLMHRHYALDRLTGDRLLPASCGLVVALDALEQPPGGLVEETDLDRDADVAAFRRAGAVALKLLVIWRDDAARGRRLAMARRFVELAGEHGLLSVLEGVVRDDDRETAILEAAAELSSTGPSLYKCEVPLQGRGDLSAVADGARAIDAVVSGPWVVLSQGVEPDDFPAAVEASCRGGASGFLAGRALWTATLVADDPSSPLRQVSVPRLVALGAIVDRHGTPWREKTAA